MTVLYWLVSRCGWIWLRLFYRHRVVGRQPLLGQGAVIACNHVSFLDPVLVGCSWEEELHYLARETLFRRWGLAWLIRTLNAHPVRIGGGNAGAIRVAESVVRSGGKILIFPEGQRSWTGEIEELHSGAALITARAQSAVIPVYVHGSYEVWNRKRRFPRLIGRTVCYIGEPLHWKDYEEKGRSAGQRAMTEDMRSALLALREQALREEGS